MALVGALTSDQNNNNGSATVTLTLPAGSAAGHDVFWVSTCNVTNGTAVTLPSGHEQLATASIANNNDAVLGHKKLTSADITAGSFTVTYPSGNRAQGMGLVESGLDATTPYETVSAGSTAAASSGTTPAGTTTVDNSPVLEFGSARTTAPSAASLTFAGTYTKVGEAKNNGASGANETVAVARITTPSTAGTYGSDTVTTSPAASNIVLFTVALRAAATVTNYNGASASSATAATSGAGIVGKVTGSTLTATAATGSAGTIGAATGATLAATGGITTAGSVGQVGSGSASITATAAITTTTVRGATSPASIPTTATVTAAGTVGRSTTAVLAAAASIDAGGFVYAPGEVTPGSMVGTDAPRSHAAGSMTGPTAIGADAETTRMHHADTSSTATMKPA